MIPFFSNRVTYWIYFAIQLCIFLLLFRAIIWVAFWLLKKFYGTSVMVTSWSIWRPLHFSMAVKTATLELHLNDIHLSWKLLDLTCHRFIRVNVEGIHLEYYHSRLSQGRQNKRKGTLRPKLVTRVSRLKRFVFWCLNALFRLVEVSVGCLEAWLEEGVANQSSTFIWTVQVSGRLGLVVRPLHKKELAVVFDVDDALVQFLLKSDTPCPSTEDGLYPLAKAEFSSKVLIFLRPLALVPSERVHSIQVSTLPLSVDLLHEDMAFNLFQFISTLSRRSQPGSKVQDEGAGSAPRKVSIPEVELVLEDTSLHYHADFNDRQLTGRLTRMSVAAKFPSSSTPSPDVDAVINIQGITLNDSLRRKCASLEQILLHIEKASGVLSSHLSLTSLHASVWEDEAMFWGQHLVKDVNKTISRLRQGSQDSTQRQSAMTKLTKTPLVPFSVVTTVEASDWSVQVRIMSPSLQAKGPVVRGVMASSVGHVQWTPLDDHTSSVRASVMVSDCYLHVPGYHPLVDNPAFFNQRVDDPSVLPSLHQHLWGRVSSIGRLALQLERKVHVSDKHGRKTDGSDNKNSGREGGSAAGVYDWGGPLVISGEGTSLVLEWSQPTITMINKVLEHYRVTYLQPSPQSPSLPASSPSSHTSSSSSSSLSSSSSFLSKLSSSTSVQVCFQVADVNVFLYGMTPDPPCTMLRLDAASLVAPPPTSTISEPQSSNQSTSFASDNSSLSHTATVNLHGFLVDSLRLEDASSLPFQCSSVSNLVQGDGVAVVDTLSLGYDHQIKNVDIEVKKVWLSWNPTHHLSLFHTVTSVVEDIRGLRGALSSTSASSSSSTESSTGSSSQQSEDSEEVILLGSNMKSFLNKAPISVNTSLEKVEAFAMVDRNTRVGLTFDKSEVAVNGGVASAHCLRCEVLFDKNKIVCVDRLAVRFPHDAAVEGAHPGGREKFKDRLVVESNDVLLIRCTSFKCLFPHNYQFNKTFDKVVNVRKFLQLIHSGTDGNEDGGGSHGDGDATAKKKKSQQLPLDLQLECNEFIFQICDDPFEIKLRANYELQCDEYEQKTERHQALFRKIDQIKREHGEYAISGQETQEFYDALERENGRIFVSRARKIYDSLNMEDVSVFLFTMSSVKIRAMCDPSMLSREKLVASITDMDSISPMPDNYQFSTLWGGYVTGMAQSLELQVRDYPCPMIGLEEATIAGRIVFAEQEAQEREKREAVIHVDKPWGDVTVQRKLPPLKYYYDLEITSSVWDMAYGPCLEPGMAQANNSFNLLSSVSVDPSKPLAYWDKLRLLFHGTIRLKSKELRVVLPSTFDPYNSVEYLELKLTDVEGDLLTNTKLTLSGSAQLLVHTASKYDECKLLSLPSVSACVGLHWRVGGGDPNRHHYVVRCAPDKLPTRSDKQEHDSYSCFRSYNLDLDFSVDVKAPPTKVSPLPRVLLYSSTLRSLQQYQMLMKWNVTRPTKRGKYFKNVKPKRPPMLRHWRDVKVSVSFPKTRLRYWSSRALQRGVECYIDEAKLSLNLNLTLVTLNSGLTQRKRADWTIRSLDASAKGIIARIKSRTDIVTNSALKEEDELYVFTDGTSDHDTSMLLAVNSISYSRRDVPEDKCDGHYTHKLEVTDTRLRWNSSNRDVVLGLYDSFKQRQELKRYLSTEALKSVLSEKDLDMEKNSPGGTEEDRRDSNQSPPLSSPRVRHSSSGNTMLDQLVQDISNQYVKYVDERAPTDPLLKGIMAINMDDITDTNWLIELLNTQVVLQGVEQPGYVVASSHLTNIIGCDHEPKMKKGVYVSKKSWVAKIQDLQYFTTQSVKDHLDYVPWLPPSVISRPCMGKADQNHSKFEADREANLNALLGTLGPSDEKKSSFVSFAEAVGGTVSSIRMNDLDEEADRGVAEAAEGHGIQLQRVAPRCHCQVIYVTYGDQMEAEINRAASPAHSASPPRPSALSGSGDVDTFTFRYPSVEVHTTSYQYSLIIDIINNLLLHKESKKKEVLSRHKRMQFSLQLSSKVKDPRKAVLQQQNKVKKCLQAQRDAETEYFLEQKTERNPEKLKQLEDLLASSKEELSQSSLKLSMLVSTFRQSQLYAASTSQALTSEPMRRIEIWVDDTHWTLTHSDGQLRLADITITNFSYNRMTFTDDSGEHRLELGAFRVQNLMPNLPQVYQQVLTPYDPNEKHLRVDKNVTLRVYCKDKAPVAGISVKEHLEVNVVPLNVRLTSRFYQTMQNFFFPKAEDLPDVPETDHSHLFGPVGSEASGVNENITDGGSLSLSRGSSLRRSTLSMSPSISSSRSNHSPPPSYSANDLKKLDDVEKMKHRANKTKTFIYVKIPQTTLCVTYKSENVSFKDLQNQRMTVPTLEYHNRNWTWTDMLMEVKRDYKRAIVGQTIKSVIGMKGSSDEVSGLASPKLSRNTDIIFGRQSPSTQSKSGKTKKIFSKRSSKDGDSLSLKGEGKGSPSSPAKTRYNPPLSDAEMSLNRSPGTLAKQSHSLDHNSS